MLFYSFLHITCYFPFLLHFLAGEFQGGKRFLALAARAALSHAEARAVCQQVNATLPRRLPAETVTFLNSKFMSLTRSHGHYLNFWLNECTSSGECYIWSIDSYTASKSKISTLDSASRNGSFYVACESGELIALTTLSVFIL